MSDTPSEITTPDATTASEKPRNWLHDGLCIGAFALVIIGGWLTGEGFFGTLWLAIKLVLSAGAIIVMMALSKAKPTDPGAVTFIHIALLIAAFVILLTK